MARGTIGAAERFEVIADLYYACTGHLRPGKSAPLGMNQDPNSDENRERFDHWMATECFRVLIDRVAFLEKRKAELLDTVESLEAELAK